MNAHLKTGLAVAAAILVPGGIAGFLLWKFWWVPNHEESDEDGTDVNIPDDSADDAAEAPMSGNFGLANCALQVAQAMQAKFPGAVITSGLRDLAAQAHAMASNVPANRQWITQTYASDAAKGPLQAWVDANPDATDVDSIAAGLLSVLQGYDAATLHALSWHLTGDAFDVQPSNDTGLHDWLAAQAKSVSGAKFLDTEGGLQRWHSQYPASATWTDPDAAKANVS
jgi:hypothetical protein